MSQTPDKSANWLHFEHWRIRICLGFGAWDLGFGPIWAVLIPSSLRAPSTSAHLEPSDLGAGRRNVVGEIV